MAIPLMDADELVAHLRKTTLPTVLIEGKDDVKVYRNIEPRLGLGKIDFLGCGGRNTVLEVYRRRAEFPGSNVAFLVDQDLWYFQGKPEEFADVLCTQGWSLENDLYFDGRERLHELLDAQENTHFELLIADVAKWFAFEVEQSMAGAVRDYGKVQLVSPKVTLQGTWGLRPEFLHERGWTEPAPDLQARVCENSYSGLHGKLILECFKKIFMHSRDPEAVKYHSHQLMDLCYREGVKPQEANSRMNQLIKALTVELTISF